MAEHTPGPWKVEPMDNTDDDEKASGFAYLVGPEPAYDGWVPPVEWRFRIADARLIAAAPDLLAALEDVLDGVPIPKDVIERACAAIAEAKGEA
jgi:hypothetical protein